MNPNERAQQEEIPGMLLQCMSPVMAQSGRLDCAEGCPLLGVKRTSQFDRAMSAYDPFRTSHAIMSKMLDQPRVGRMRTRDLDV